MMDKMEFFKVLPEDEYEVTQMLYQTGKSLNCKIVFKTRPTGYRVTFNMPSNRKTLFWMEISKGTLLVKANLIHIDEYGEKILSCPDVIKTTLTATKTCENCSPHCGSAHIPFHIDNIEYMPCYFKGHYFAQMDKSDWYALNELIVLENSVVQA